MEQNKLLNLLKQHPETTQKVNEIKDREELLNFIKKYLPDYTTDELKKDMENILDMNEISEDDLENVSGGDMTVERVSNKEFLNTVKNWVSILKFLI